MKRAILIDKNDNVATVTESVKSGEEVVYTDPNSEDVVIIAKSAVPLFHKIAIKDIKKNDKIVKYGEHIGMASEDIEAGCHVHVHNVEDYRENLEERE